MVRIDSLEPGAKVRLKFCGSGWNAEHDEDAVFVGVTGEGNDRRATFRSLDQRTYEDRVEYEWDAYRYNGRWAYGSSAETLRLLAVND